MGNLGVLLGEVYSRRICWTKYDACTNLQDRDSTSVFSPTQRDSGISSHHERPYDLVAFSTAGTLDASFIRPVQQSISRAGELKCFGNRLRVLVAHGGSR